MRNFGAKGCPNPAHFSGPKRAQKGLFLYISKNPGFGLEGAPDPENPKKGGGPPEKGVPPLQNCPFSGVFLGSKICMQ